VAFGALKIFIFFAVLDPDFKLTEFCLPVAGKRDIFLIFRCPLIIVSGKHTKDCEDIACEAKRGKKTCSDKQVKNGQDKTKRHGEHGQIIRAVTAFHKASKGHFEFLPERHGCCHSL
jgi:hypothetical protein